MKKFTFFLAVLFSATFANAQITLEHTFDGWVTISTDLYGDIYHYIQSPYFYDMEPGDNSSTIKIVNLYDIEDFSLYKSVSIQMSGGYSVALVSRNILSTDGKVCFMLFSQYQDPESPGRYSFIYDEDGRQIATVKGDSPSLVKVNEKYILMTRDEIGDAHKTYIYSVPGNGEPSTDVVAPVSPKRSSARKIARDGQVLVETETSTYTMRGQEIK